MEKRTLTAYKHHDRDLIIFNKGLSLVFRNYEDTTGCGDLLHCPQQWCGENGNNCAEIDRSENYIKSPDRTRAVANYSTLIWVYEWPTSSNDLKEDSEKSTKSAAFGYAAILSSSGVLSSNEEELLFDALFKGDDSTTALLIAIKEADKEQRRLLVDHLKRFLKKGL